MSLSALAILTNSANNIFANERERSECKEHNADMHKESDDDDYYETDDEHNSRRRKDDDDEDDDKKKDDEDDDGVAIDDILAVIGGKSKTKAKKELTIDPSKKNIIVVIGEVPSELHEMLKESGVVYNDMGKIDAAKLLKNEYMSKKDVSENIVEHIMNGDSYLHVVRLIYPSMLDTVHLINTFKAKGALITYINFNTSFLFDDMRRKLKEKGIIFNPSSTFIEPVRNYFDVKNESGEGDALVVSKKELIKHMMNYKMFYESESELMRDVERIAKSETTTYTPKFEYNTVLSI